MPDNDQTRSVVLLDVDVADLLCKRLCTAIARAEQMEDEVTDDFIDAVAEAMGEAQTLFEMLLDVVDGRRVRLVVDPETGHD